MKECPLEFWKQKAAGFPILSRAVREVLSIPASQTTSERAFSVGSYICNPKRNKFKPEKIEELITMKLNQDAVKDYLAIHNVPLLAKPSNDTTIDYDMIPYIDEMNLSDNEDEEDNSEEEVVLVDIIVLQD